MSLPQLPELGRRFSQELAELFVEMTQVVEAAIVRDIHNVQVGIH